VLCGDVIGLVEILAEVIELEDLVVERIRVGRTECLPGRAVDLGAQQPAMVIERPLPHHLEVLGGVPRRRFGIFRVERIGKARTLDRRLLDAIDQLRRA